MSAVNWSLGLVCLRMSGIPRALGCSAYLSVWWEVGAFSGFCLSQLEAHDFAVLLSFKNGVLHLRACSSLNYCLPEAIWALYVDSFASNVWFRPCEILS